MAMQQVAGDAWTPELAERTARELGIALRPAHWLVLGCARELSAAGIRPELAVLARASGLSVETIALMFPDAARSIGWIADVG